MAPGELGDLRSAGRILLSARGKELYLFDGAKHVLSRFLETGKRAGEPVELALTDSLLSLPPFWMAVSGDQVALASPIQVAAFDLEGACKGHRELAQVSSLVLSPKGDWGVGLAQLPGPGTSSRFGNGSEPPRPRVVRLDREMVTTASGLEAERGLDGNAGAARALKLVAAPPNRLYAFELANYSIYELDASLKLHATWKDPKIQFEGGAGNQDDAKTVAAREAQMQAEAKTIPGLRESVTIPPSPPPRMQATTFSYRVVARAAAWDDATKRIVVLIGPGIVGPSHALDLIDPETGEVSRLHLRLPAGVEQEDVSQLAISQRYVWLRDHDGNQRTFRLDREALNRAVPVATLEAEP